MDRAHHAVLAAVGDVAPKLAEPLSNGLVVTEKMLDQATEVVQWVATYLSGKRLALGWGGYFSLVANCDASMGLSLTAINQAGSSAPKASRWVWGALALGLAGAATPPPRPRGGRRGRSSASGAR